MFPHWNINSLWAGMCFIVGSLNKYPAQGGSCELMEGREEGQGSVQQVSHQEKANSGGQQKTKPAVDKTGRLVRQLKSGSFSIHLQNPVPN